MTDEGRPQDGAQGPSSTVAARKRRRWRDPLIVLAVAVVAHAIFVAAAPALYEHMVLDFYDVEARNILDGNGFSLRADGAIPTIDRAPLFPVALAAVFWPTGESLWAARIALALLDCLTALLVYWTVVLWPGVRGRAGPTPAEEREKTRRLALLAGVVCGVQPLSAYYAAKVVPETLMAFLVALAVLAFVWWGRRRSWPAALCLGLALGAGILSKSVMIGLPLVAAVAMGFMSRRPGLAWWRALRQPLAVVLVAAAVVAPWTARNYLVSGAFVPVQTHTWYSFWFDLEAGTWYVSPTFNARIMPLGGNPLDLGPRETIVQERALARQARTWMVGHPFGMAAKTARNTVEFWYFGAEPRRQTLVELLVALQAPLVGLGIWWGLSRRGARAGVRGLALLALVVILYLDLLYAPIFAIMRYSLPVYPPAAILLAMGLVWLDDVRRAATGRRPPHIAVP